MRLESVLDSLYLLSSLWGPVPGSQVCTSSSRGLPRVAHEDVWTRGAGAPAGVTAFIDVNVVPMDTERVLANHTILVEGGKITALGPATTVKVPAGAMRVDGRGKYLMPGFTDMHFHLWGDVARRGMARVTQDSLSRELAGGVTAVRFLEGHWQNRQAWLDTLRTRPEVLMPHIYWPAPEIATSTRPDSVAVVVTAAKAAGYDFIVTPEITTPNVDGFTSETLSPTARVVFDSMLAVTRRLHFPVASHNHVITFDALLALGATSGDYSHAVSAVRDSLGWKNDGLTASYPEVPLATTQRLAAVLQRAGVWFTPTLQCQTGKGDEGSGAAPTTYIKGALQLTKALHDAGGKLLLSGDDGWTVHDELGAMVRAGLTPYQALRTGTYNPAEYFGQLHERGTVAVGKRADLVLLYDNPLEDIRRTREPAGVMLAGRWLDRAELDQHLIVWKSSGYHEPSRPAPQPWLIATLNSRGIVKAGGNSPAHPKELQKLEALTDSLAATAPSDKGAYELLMRQVAAELGVIRAILKAPKQQERFDVIARVWLRSQARLGHEVAIPGVVLTS